MIVTTYLTAKPDPQRGVRVRPNDAKRMMLARGAAYRGVPLVVFHDELSPEFIEAEKGEWIDFIKVEQPKDGMSCCDYRYSLFYNLTTVLPSDDLIWYIDLFDVILFRNPDEMAEKFPSYSLWLAEHGPEYRIQGGNKSRLAPRLQQLYGESWTRLKGLPVLMDGTWGGRAGVCLEVLRVLRQEIEWQSTRMFNCNMPCFNYVLWTQFRDRAWVGSYPFVSPFGKRDRSGATVLAHK